MKTKLKYLQQGVRSRFLESKLFDQNQLKHLRNKYKKMPLKWTNID